MPNIGEKITEIEQKINEKKIIINENEKQFSRAVLKAYREDVKKTRTEHLDWEYAERLNAAADERFCAAANQGYQAKTQTSVKPFEIKRLQPISHQDFPFAEIAIQKNQMKKLRSSILKSRNLTVNEEPNQTMSNKDHIAAVVKAFQDKPITEVEAKLWRTQFLETLMLRNQDTMIKTVTEIELDFKNKSEYQEPFQVNIPNHWLNHANPAAPIEQEQLVTAIKIEFNHPVQVTPYCLAGIIFNPDEIELTELNVQNQLDNSAQSMNAILKPLNIVIPKANSHGLAHNSLNNYELRIVPVANNSEINLTVKDEIMTNLTTPQSLQDITTEQIAQNSVEYRTSFFYPTKEFIRLSFKHQCLEKQCQILESEIKTLETEKAVLIEAKQNETLPKPVIAISKDDKKATKFAHKSLRSLSDSRITGKGKGKQTTIKPQFLSTSEPKLTINQEDNPTICHVQNKNETSFSSSSSSFESH